MERENEQKTGPMESPSTSKAHLWYQSTQLYQHQVYGRSRVIVPMAGSHKPLTGPTEGRHCQLGCLKHAKANPNHHSCNAYVSSKITTAAGYNKPYCHRQITFQGRMQQNSEIYLFVLSFLVSDTRKPAM